MLDNIQELETLPADDSDLIIPTRLSQIDSDIAFIKDNIANMQEQLQSKESDRAMLIKRAQELHITTDKEWKIIECPVYAKKKVDVERLKKLEPERYNQILANIRSRIQDKINGEMDKADGFISQADVKSVIRDKGVLAMVIPEPAEPIGYNFTVVRR